MFEKLRSFLRRSTWSDPSLVLRDMAVALLELYTANWLPAEASMCKPRRSRALMGLPSSENRAFRCPTSLSAFLSIFESVAKWHWKAMGLISRDGVEVDFWSRRCDPNTSEACSCNLRIDASMPLRPPAAWESGPSFLACTTLILSPASLHLTYSLSALPALPESHVMTECPAFEVSLRSWALGKVTLDGALGVEQMRALTAPMDAS
mmetsp:Transcript_322/g.910  ORF Transcript_322/g.910 Transcript_322/m.910 type:complete len:207 (+) Transcript_322:708-1328(+)